MSDEFDRLEAELLRTLLDHSPEVFLLVDPAVPVIVGARGPAERLLGRPVSYLAGLSLDTLRPSITPPRLAVLGAAHLAQPGQWMEMAVAGPEGATRVCSVWIAPLGAPGRGLTLVRLADVTERFELEQKLHEAQQRAQKASAERARERLAHQERRRADLLYIFAAGLSHELNNPLAAALANFAAAQDICREAAERPSPENASEMHELMRDSQAALRRLEAVVKKLRQLEYTPRVQALDVAAWLRQRPDLAGVEIAAPPALPAHSDPLLLERILVPLLDNARRAVNGRPGILLALEKAPDGFCLRLEDSGPGIPADLAERVFDPFFTTRPPGQGLGLGLFFARHAAEQLGGELGLAPREGGGCVFCATLPLDSSAFAQGDAVSSPYESLRTGVRS